MAGWTSYFGILSQCHPTFDLIINIGRSAWHTFNGSVILPYILKDIWWMNNTLWHIESVTKIDLIIKVGHSNLFLTVLWLCFISWSVSWKNVIMSKYDAMLDLINLGHSVYRKFPKYSDTQKNCCNHSKIWTMWLYHRVMSPNDADGMANSVDPDQTAPLGAVWSGSALFAQTCLSENLGKLRYISWSNVKAGLLEVKYGG